METYQTVPKYTLQNIIVSNLRNTLGDTIACVQYLLSNEGKYISNQSIIEELGFMLSDAELLNRLAT